MVLLAPVEMAFVIFWSCVIRFNVLPTSCDDDPVPTRESPFCNYLEDVGYFLVLFGPGLLLLGALGVAFTLGREKVMHLGFLVAVVLLGLSLDDPWPGF